jgi:hypothetical protein
MTGFLIQVSGHSIEEKAAPAYVEGAKGSRFCDEPLQHREYFNASPFWKREGFSRREAWQTLTPGDEGLLYCTGSVDEHGACLSHILTIDTVTRDDEGARLEFSSMEELVPKIPYSDIRGEIAAGRLSEEMKYCGQEGFNITLVPESDIGRVRSLSSTEPPASTSREAHPDDSLRDIAEDHFGDS